MELLPMLPVLPLPNDQLGIGDIGIGDIGYWQQLMWEGHYRTTQLPHDRTPQTVILISVTGDECG